MALKEIKVSPRVYATKPRNSRRPFVILSDPPPGKFKVINLFVDETGQLVVEYDDGT